MNLPFRFARRYLFAKRSTNAIHIVTGVSVFGMALGAAALILALSVFNGFEDLISDMYSSFNPSVKVTPAKGKTFASDSLLLAEIQAVEGVDVVSETLEEIAVFQYRDNTDYGLIKGVDSNFVKVTGIDSTVYEGSYQLSNGQRDLAILGLGMRNKLGVNVGDEFRAVRVYTLKQKRRGPLDKPFVNLPVYPVGTFVIQQEFDNQYVVTNLDFVRQLLRKKDKTSAFELSLLPEADPKKVVTELQNVLGTDYIVKDRYQQQESFMKLMQLEKWLSYAIVSLMMLLVAFNLIGALWMVVLEKRPDIAILKSMGASEKMVSRIFLYEGILLSAIGLLIGFVLALGIYWLQKNVGLVGVPGEAIVEAYPISLRATDFIVVSVTVLLIGLLASILPARRAKRVPALIRGE